MAFEELKSIVEKEFGRLLGTKLTESQTSEWNKFIRSFSEQINHYYNSSFLKEREERLRKRYNSNSWSDRRKLANYLKKLSTHDVTIIADSFGLLSGAPFNPPLIHFKGKPNGNTLFFMVNEKPQYTGVDFTRPEFNGIIFPVVAAKGGPVKGEYLLQELLPCVSLDSYFDRFKNSDEASSIAKKIGAALALLHNAGYTYGGQWDKLYHSIMLDSNGNCRFTNLAEVRQKGAAKRDTAKQDMPHKDITHEANDLISLIRSLGHTDKLRPYRAIIYNAYISGINNSEEVYGRVKKFGHFEKEGILQGLDKGAGGIEIGARR